MELYQRLTVYTKTNVSLWIPCLCVIGAFGDTRKVKHLLPLPGHHSDSYNWVSCIAARSTATVPAVAGFLRNEVTVVGDTVKETACVTATYDGQSMFVWLSSIFRRFQRRRIEVCPDYLCSCSDLFPYMWTASQAKETRFTADLGSHGSAHRRYFRERLAKASCNLNTSNNWASSLYQSLRESRAQVVWMTFTKLRGALPTLSQIMAS